MIGLLAGPVGYSDQTANWEFMNLKFKILKFKILKFKVISPNY